MSGLENLFEFLGEANHRDRTQTQFCQFRAGGIQLAFAAINDN